MSQSRAMTSAGLRPRTMRKPKVLGDPGWLLGRVFTIGWCSFVYLFLLLPLIVIAGASFHSATGYAVMVFPPEDPTIKWYLEIPDQQYRALALSVGLGLLTAAVSCILGVPAALELGDQ